MVRLRRWREIGVLVGEQGNIERFLGVATHGLAILIREYRRGGKGRLLTPDQIGELREASRRRAAIKGVLAEHAIKLVKIFRVRAVGCCLNEYARHVEARGVGERPERDPPDELLRKFLGGAVRIGEPDDHLARGIRHPEGGREGPYSFLAGRHGRKLHVTRGFLHPLGQKRDLEGCSDLLAQARRRKDERLIAVRLQHDEVTCHRWLFPTHHCAGGVSSGVNECRSRFDR